MDVFNAKQSPDDNEKLIEQLRTENAVLRDENTTLHQTCLTLREQLASAESERAQAQAELSTLTDAAQVLQDDRESLRNKNAELQAAVDRLTDIVTSDWEREVKEMCMGNTRFIGAFPLTRYSPQSERCDYFMTNVWCSANSVHLGSEECGCFTCWC